MLSISSAKDSFFYFFMSVRISGVFLPNKRVVIAITYIFGIGDTSAKKILADLKIDENIRTDSLTEEQVNNIRAAIDSIPVEGDLRQKIAADIKRLKDINCYRGRRHRVGLPVRGQRTKCNARTRKGKKKTVANKKQ
jgi:small subunit ribosomal protein S13